MMKIGIIGCGMLGVQHARTLSKFPDVQIASLYNRTRSRAERLAAEVGGTVHDSYEELLQQDLDAVYVATADHLHVEYAKAVLAAGKHLFLEKVIATSLQDGAEIVAAGDKHPELVAMIGYPLRFRPSFRKVIEVVSRADAGKALQAWSLRTHFLHPELISYDQSRNEYYKVPDWYYKGEHARLTQGPVFSHASHDYDLLRLMCGEVESVFAYGGTYLFPQNTVTDGFTLCLRFKNGAVGQVATPWVTRVANLSFGVATENLTVVNSNNEVRVKDDHGPEERISFEDNETWNQWHYMHRQFIDSIKHGKPSPVPLLDGLKAIAISEAVVRSLKERREVFVENV